MKTSPQADMQRACRTRLKGGAVMLLASVWLAGSVMLPGGLQAEPPQDFDKTSLALRTALHYDPSVDVPLGKLIELYRAAGRTEELLGLYSAHLSQYHDDASARLVLARLYAALKDRRAAEFLKAAVAQHPDNAQLAWQQAHFLKDQYDPKAVEEMARAVSLEKSSSRRAQWFSELMKHAGVQGREDLVLAQTGSLLEEGALTPEQRLQWARQALNIKLTNTAEAFMAGLNPASFATDSAVEASLLQAELLAAKGKAAEATATLDALLGKLAPDYWRRREILMLRLDLAAGSDDRDRLVSEARARWLSPEGKNEANALTLADVLEASQRGAEALTMLREAATALPDSFGVEARLLDVWEKAGADAEALAWLGSLRKKHADRPDLHLREVRWLFTAGQPKEARESFAALLKTLPTTQQVERSVETSRWLRRRNQLTDAAGLLEGTLQLTPDRWDLRRELGELYFAQRRKDDAAKLFKGDWSRDIAVDARLEIAQFLMVKQLWLEASALLEPWLVQQPDSFDGQLLMARIAAKLDDDTRVESLFTKARALCDSDARYQSWLETVMEYAETREETEVWVKQEMERISPAAGAAWTEENFGRAMALMTQASSRGAETEAETLLGRVLADAGLSEDKKLLVEKLKLDLIASDTTRSTDVEEGLRKLMEKDAAHKEDYRIRLALLYQQAQREDLAWQVLEGLDIMQCTEVNSLRGILGIYIGRGDTQRALNCARRLTELEPAERAHWTQWLGLLAQEGEEDRLRVALREVMGKAHDWKLKDEVLGLLRNHLVASQWRTVLADMNGENPDWSAARRAAAGLKDLELTTEQARWADWLAAYFSMMLKDKPAVESALAMLSKADSKQWITFPDGLELSVRGAIDSLQDAPAETPASPVASPSGPLPDFQMRWGFALEDDRVVTKVLAPDQGRFIFISDNRQTLYAIETQSGKLRWTLAATGGSSRTPRTMMRTPSGMPNRRYNNGQPELTMPVEMVANGDRLCYLAGAEVVCVRADTGDLLWKSSIGEPDMSQAGFFAAQSRIALSGDRVVAWNPSDSKVYALSMASGKMIWQSEVPAPHPPAANGMGGWNGNDMYSKLRSGLSVEGRQIFVFSRTAATLNADDGSVLWRLGIGEVPGFPLDLNSVEEGAAGSSMSLAMPQRLTMVRTARRNTMRQVNADPFGRGGVNFANQRWAYGNALRAGLEGYYAAYAILHGRQVWVLNGNGSAFVSMMGLPLAQPSYSGTMVGFAGDSLVAVSGDLISAASSGNAGGRLPLFQDSDTVAAGRTSPDKLAAAVSGRRLYASNDKRLRAADVRSGSVLFDVALPAGLAEWTQALEKAPAPAVVPGYTNSYGGGGNNRGSRRTYLPQGIFIQDDRGGGTFCENRAAVVGGVWIFPVAENALACVSGRTMETNVQTARNP